MLGRGQPPLQGREQRVEVIVEQGMRIEPEARENLGPKDSVGSWGEGYEPIAPTNEPSDLVGFQADEDVFQDPGPLVIFELGSQVDLP